MIHILNSKQTYDTSIQVLQKNQMVVHHGMGAQVTRFVVYRIDNLNGTFNYHLINLETKEFALIDLVRPVKEKFGIGFYYDSETPEFMDAFEVLMLKSEAEYQKRAKEEKQQEEQECKEHLTAIGRERLSSLIPADTKAIIIAELHEDDSDSMTDYFGYHTVRTVILGFSSHTRDLFSEMRKYAANFEETAHLTEENEKYEHREKYAMGEGYYLGQSKYSGWIVRKEKFYGNQKNMIERYALIAGEEDNLFVKVRKSQTETASEAITGNYIIVNYSEKALAVFGDTRQIKDELKALGGRFNPKLTHDDKKQAGWIFSKSKEQELRDLLTVK